MRRICGHTRKADESSSSLFKFRFTATAKKRAGVSIEFEEAEEAGEADMEPVANAVPLLLHPVPVPQAQQSTQSQQSIQSVNPHNCIRPDHPDDIGVAVSWPGGSTKVPADLKLHLLTKTMKPTGKATDWPSSVLSQKTYRITEFVFNKFSWWHYFSELHCGLYCKAAQLLHLNKLDKTLINLDNYLLNR